MHVIFFLSGNTIIHNKKSYLIILSFSLNQRQSINQWSIFQLILNIRITQAFNFSLDSQQEVKAALVGKKPERKVRHSVRLIA
jgi:hypothetical protein